MKEERQFSVWHTLRRITIISALQMKQSLIERRTSARRAPLSESSAAPEEESVWGASWICLDRWYGLADLGQVEK